MRKVWLLLITIMAMGLPAWGESVPPPNPRTMTFPPLAFQIPKAERVVLSNGMVVHLMEDHELPMVSMTAYLNVGSIYEPAEKTGLAGLTGAVLRSGGTRSISADKLDEELEFMASFIESSIGSDVGNVTLSSLNRNLDRTLALFSQVLREPDFREDRVELAKRKSLEALRRQNDDPKGVADRELGKALYEGHQLGRYPTTATVQSITRDDLAAFHRRFYRPNNVILAVAGDFRRDELLAKLEEAFAGWEPAAIDFPVVSPPATEVKPAVLLVRKDINQSVIRMGHLGIDKSNPDMYAVKVMDYILGGGFNSRLVTEIRSNQGLAYNVDAFFDVGRRFVGTFKAETETKAESTGKAMSLMRDIIAGMTKEPVSEQELLLAKDAIVNSFIFGFARTDSVANQWARLEYYGYPPGYLENYRANIAKVTRDDVLRVARKYLHPELLTLVVVGDEKRFDKPLKEFGAVREIKLENGK